MLLTIGHDHAKLVCVAIDGLPIPVQRTTIEDSFFLKIAAVTRSHLEILTPCPLILNALSPNTGSETSLGTGSASVAWDCGHQGNAADRLGDDRGRDRSGGLVRQRTVASGLCTGALDRCVL